MRLILCLPESHRGDLSAPINSGPVSRPSPYKNIMRRLPTVRASTSMCQRADYPAAMRILITGAAGMLGQDMASRRGRRSPTGGAHARPGYHRFRGRPGGRRGRRRRRDQLRRLDRRRRRRDGRGRRRSTAPAPATSPRRPRRPAPGRSTSPATTCSTVPSAPVARIGPGRAAYRRTAAPSSPASARWPAARPGGTRSCAPRGCSAPAGRAFRRRSCGWPASATS